MTLVRSGWRVARWVLPGVLAAGCTGGQSGSEGTDTLACPDAKVLGPDDKPPTYEGETNSPREFLAKFSGASIDGIWYRTEERSSLTVDLSGAPTAATYRCGYSIDTTATLRTDDGALDVTTPVRISGSGSVASFSVRLPELSPRVVGAPLWASDEALARMWLGDLVPPELRGRGIYVSLSVATPTLSRAVVMQDQRVLGAWATEGVVFTGPPVLYTAPPELASACIGADAFQRAYPDPAFEYTPVASADAALAMEVGTWVRCSDSNTYDRAGIQILPDGSFRDLALEGGGLVARTGFEHEGIARIPVRQGDPSDLYFLSLDGFSSWGNAPVSSRALVVPSATYSWPPGVYLPSDLSVVVPPPAFADGERAGTAGCGVVEQGIVGTYDDAAAALDGTFVLCSGDLGPGTTGIRFSHGQLERLGDGGTVLETSGYQLEPDLHLPVAFLLGEDRQWLVTVSRAPRKLRIEKADSKSWPSAAVVSAVP